MRIVATLRVMGECETSVFIGKCEDVLDFLQEAYYKWMFGDEVYPDIDQTWDMRDQVLWDVRDQVLLELVYITNPDQMLEYAEKNGVYLDYREITQEEIQSLM